MNWWQILIAVVGVIFAIWLVILIVMYAFVFWLLIKEKMGESREL